MKEVSHEARVVRRVPSRGGAGAAGRWCGPGGGWAAEPARLRVARGRSPQPGGRIPSTPTGRTPRWAWTGAPLLTGVVFNGIAVFDFNAITVSSNQTFVGMGSLPVAFLSRSDITINGTIDVSAPQPFLPGSFSPGGPGGFGSGSGPGAGQSGFYGNLDLTVFSNPGGGGFGGSGGNGSCGLSLAPAFPPSVVPFGGGKGGSLTVTWRPRFKGGAAVEVTSLSTSASSGGGGGGAIEVGAIGEHLGQRQHLGKRRKWRHRCRRRRQRRWNFSSR